MDEPELFENQSGMDDCHILKLYNSNGLNALKNISEQNLVTNSC